MTPRNMSFRVRSCASSVVTAAVLNVINRRNFSNYSWNRRTNTQQFGEQQGLFPILGLDWRF